MKFSLLIAHYNNYIYFLDCYKSILKQTYDDIEIIIVDDFSNDGSYELLKELLKNDEKIKLFQNDKNKGVGFTKRRCVEESSGEICGFIDPDDLIVEDTIFTAINIFNSKKNIIAIYSKLKFINQNLTETIDFHKSKQIINGNPLFFNLDFMVNHFFAFRKEFYLQTKGIDKTLTSAVDQDLYLKLYELGDFYFINKTLYLYRRHEKGISQDKSKKEKLNKNWDLVLRNTLERRQIKELYGIKVDEIPSLQHFLFQKENTFSKKIIRKLKKIFF